MHARQTSAQEQPHQRTDVAIPLVAIPVIVLPGVVVAIVAGGVTGALCGAGGRQTFHGDEEGAFVGRAHLVSAEVDGADAWRVGKLRQSARLVAPGLGKALGSAGGKRGTLRPHRDWPHHWGWPRPCARSARRADACTRPLTRRNHRHCRGRRCTECFPACAVRREGGKGGRGVEGVQVSCATTRREQPASSSARRRRAPGTWLQESVAHAAPGTDLAVGRE